MTAMTAAAVPYALAGYEVILDFSIPPWFLDAVRKVVKIKDVPLDYVVLRPSESVFGTGRSVPSACGLLHIMVFIRPCGGAK